MSDHTQHFKEVDGKEMEILDLSVLSVIGNSLAPIHTAISQSWAKDKDYQVNL